MKPIEEMKLNERLKLYAEGDLKNEIPRHSFDFTKEDEENIMGALRIVWLLSRQDFVHNYQRERKDLVDYCNVTNGIIRIAKRFVEKCPLKAIFRLNFEKEEDEQALKEREENETDD